MKLKIKIKTPFGNLKAGTSMSIDANDKGVPLEKFWRNRLRDSKVDGCIEVISDSSSKTKEDKKPDAKKPVKEEK